AHTQSLLAWVDMVKLECPDAGAVPADRTSAACLCHEYLLDLSPPARDGVRPAALTAVIAAAFKEELRLAVVNARHRHGDESRFLGSSRGHASRSSSSMMRGEVVAAQPVPDRTLAPPHRGRDLGRGHPGCHKLLQPLAVEPALRSVPIGVLRLEAMFLDPVRDRRRILA